VAVFEERGMILCRNRELSMVTSTSIVVRNRENTSNEPILHRRGLSMSSLHVPQCRF
jgi:hypothetical protein